MICIIIFGDSITFGKGEFPKIGWAGRLKNIFETKEKDIRNCIYNLGVSGDNSISLLNRIEIEMKARINLVNPDDRFIVIVAIGTNDCIGLNFPENTQINPEIFERNIFEIVKIIKKYTNEIIITSLTPVDEDKTTPYDDNRYLINDVINKYNIILKKCSSVEKIFFIDLYKNLIVKKYEKYLYDGIHPNKKGYDLIYSIIKDFIIKNVIN